MSNRGKNNISLNDWSMKEISKFNYNTHETNLLLKMFKKFIMIKENIYKVLQLLLSNNFF